MADAEACSEAVRRPSMRFVPVKSAAQQATCMLRAAPRRPPRSALGARRGVRDQLIGQRTATSNALRGHLAEFGLVAAQRRQGLRELLAVLGDLEDRRVPPRAREVLASLTGQLRDLEARLAELDRRLVQMTRADPVCRALAEVPGIGPGIATAFTAAVPDPGRFASGRHLAARGWLPGATSGGRPGAPRGLVPRQHATGGKPRPLRLSKRGDAYLRRQLIHGARAVVRVSQARSGGLWSWVERLLARRPFNVVVAAVANKLARIVWAMLSRGEAYRPVG